MNTPEAMWTKWVNCIKKEWKIAFLSALILGLCIHLPIMVSDIPNHDGLDSMYFDQNMITSGRWFLMVACGFSSFYSVPWIASVLGMLFLALTAVALTEFLELKSGPVIVLSCGLLVAFPALASTFAYVFTMDGYMLALLLAVVACLLTKKYKYGFIWGGICLAFSLGTYQAYLAFAMLLCVYGILELLMGPRDLKEKLAKGAKFLYMGIIGVASYYGILQLLLFIQGKQLADYQGINSIAGAGSQSGIFHRVLGMYRDFFAFTLKGDVFAGGFFGTLAVVVLMVALCMVLLGLILKRKWWKNPGFYGVLLLLAGGIPLATNVMLMISPEVNYHLLMRYQWVLFLILPLAYVDKYGEGKGLVGARWMALLAVVVLIMHYAVTDNIAYSNLQKKYEKTYSYCLRLLDRIESTEGYYPGIPVAIVGIVAEQQYPVTDITGDVTGGMIGMSGDMLVYTGANYQAFMKHYLGATLNFLPVDRVGEIYFTEEYNAMESFPGATSVKVVDDIMYVKTENFRYD